MIGSEFLDYISKLQVATYVGVEDFADKFNFIITVMVLLICTTVVTVKQYMMKPISCYMATDLGGKNLLDYVENYCWVQGTVPIAYSGRIPETDEGWSQLEKQKLLYYQWVPFVLGLQCVLFYLPRVIWQMICYNRAGTDVQHLVMSASEAVRSDEEKRQKLVKHLAHTLEQMLFQQQKSRIMKRSKSVLNKLNDFELIELKENQSGGNTNTHSNSKNINEDKYKSNLPLNIEQILDADKHKTNEGLVDLMYRKFQSMIRLISCTKNTGVFLSTAYLIIKVLYSLNSIGQIFLMEYFLGFSSQNSMFGVAVLKNILNGKDWEATLIFPRVAYCIAPLKHLGTKTNIATAQCVLPVNMLNEKIYIFLWWWIVLVSILNVYSSIRWFFEIVSRRKGPSYVMKFIQLSNYLDSDDELIAEKFAHRFLRHDGAFIIHLLSMNAGSLITSDIIQTLWIMFKNSINSNKSKINQNSSAIDNLPKSNSKNQSHFEEISNAPPYPISQKKVDDVKPKIETSSHKISMPPITSETNKSNSHLNSQRQRDYQDGIWPQVRYRIWKWSYCFLISKRLGARLFGTYLIIKFLYLSNAIGQIYMMQTFLGFKNNNYTLFGFNIVNNIISGCDWEVTLVFPRVGFCLVPLRHMGSSNYATAQCVLPMNMLNERIYIFLWFWIVLAATVTIVSIPAWFIRMSYEKSRTRFIKKYLKLGEQISKKDKLMVQKFSRQFLRHDGVFLLRMISLNAGELVCSEILCKLWQIFCQKYYYRDFRSAFKDAHQTDHLGVAICSGVCDSINKSIDSENDITTIPSAPPDSLIKKIDEE